jgi:heat shock protein HtpX
VSRRRKLFPTDHGLTVRMLGAAVATPIVVLAALFALVLIAPVKLLIGIAIAAGVGIVSAVRARAEAVRGRELTPSEAPELHAVIERLCVVADLPKPRIVLEDERQPNSWVVSVGRDNARLHVTQGLLDRLDAHELEAVVGHELAHIAHRDATVMTLVGGPGAVLVGGGARMARGGVWPMQIGAIVAWAIGKVASVGTLALSRYREFAADAGAVALTGNPAALASALMKVSEGVVAVPSRDLRAVAARDPFHLLPVAEAKNALLATHPSLEARIARLERLESRLQTFRP